MTGFFTTSMLRVDCFSLNYSKRHWRRSTGLLEFFSLVGFFSTYAIRLFMDENPHFSQLWGKIETLSTLYLLATDRDGAA